MEGVMGSFGILGGVALLFLLAVLTILIPLSVYSAQKYAYRCYGELKKVNSQLGVMQKQIKTLNKSVSFVAEVQARQMPPLRSKEAGRS